MDSQVEDSRSSRDEKQQAAVLPLPRGTDGNVIGARGLGSPTAVFSCMYSTSWGQGGSTASAGGVS